MFQHARSRAEVGLGHPDTTSNAARSVVWAWLDDDFLEFEHSGESQAEQKTWSAHSATRPERPKLACGSVSGLLWTVCSASQC